jgi:hypothetical protein
MDSYHHKTIGVQPVQDRNLCCNSICERRCGKICPGIGHMGRIFRFFFLSPFITNSIRRRRLLTNAETVAGWIRRMPAPYSYLEMGKRNFHRCRTVIRVVVPHGSCVSGGRLIHSSILPTYLCLALVEIKTPFCYSCSSSITS